MILSGRKQSDSRDEDYNSEEEENRSIRLPGLDLLNFGLRSRQRGRNRGRDRDRGQRREDTEEVQERNYNSDREIPQARSGIGSNQDKGEVTTTDSEPSSSGPCGENNFFCHGEDYIKELGLQWSPRVHNGTGIYIRDPEAPGRKRFVPVGIEQVRLF